MKIAAKEEYNRSQSAEIHFDEISGEYKSRKCGSSYTFTQTIKKVFLPEAYPYSVSVDYMEYQVWDTIQALASSLLGAISAKYLFTALGVGDSAASVMGATFSWMLQNGVGMISSITFAFFYGTSFDSDCKKWRLMADIANDLAFIFDIVSPRLGLFGRNTAFCLTSTLRAIVGLLGSATRTAVVKHQAISNNIADVSAKDSSQETLANLIGLFLNSVFISLVADNDHLSLFVSACLILIHLYSNWRAVFCLQFRTFNKSRLQLLLTNFLKSNQNSISSPSHINALEPILCAFLKRSFIKFGCRLQTILQESRSTVDLKALIKIFEAENYLLFTSGSKVYVALSARSGPSDEFKALVHANLVLISLDSELKVNLPEQLDIVYQKSLLEFHEKSLKLANEIWNNLSRSIAEYNKWVGVDQTWILNECSFDSGAWRFSLN